MRAVQIMLLGALVVLLGAKALDTFRTSQEAPQGAAWVRPDNPDLTQVSVNLGASHQCRESPWLKACRHVF